MTAVPRSKPQTADGRPLLKMSELSRRAGLPKSTILHYVNEGLLPAPRKTEANMAYYHPDCLERLEAIKGLQARHRLSLAAIRRLFAAEGEEFEANFLAEFQELVFGSAAEPALDLAGFCAATGLTPAQVAAEIRAGVLAPLEKGRFDQTDVAIGKIRRNGLGVGIAAADLSFYPRLARELVAAEMALRDRIIAERTARQNAMITMEMTRGTRQMRAYAFERAFQREILKRQTAAASKKSKKEKRS